MVRIKLLFRGKRPDELPTKFSGIVSGSCGNSRFPNPNPTIAVLSGTIDDLQSRITTVRGKEAEWKPTIAARDSQRGTIIALFTQLSSHVQNACGGDETKLLTSGFQLRSAGAPITVTAPGNLRASIGEQEGEVALAWDRVRGASSYNIECREYTDEASWQTIRTATQSRITVAGLIGGQLYAFRVRPVGAQGEGPWSDETVKRVL